MTRHVLHCVISCILILLFPALAQRKPEQLHSADQEIKIGTTLLQQREYQRAKAHFEKAQSLQGKLTAETTAGIGLAELQMGQLESAREMFKLELRLVTNEHARAQAHYMIGSAWLREAGDAPTDAGKLQAAAESFREAVRLDPLYDPAYFNLGYVLLRQNKQKESESAFRDFIRAAAENPEWARGLPLTPKDRVAPFSVVDSTAHTLSLESLRGRFVLFDFWATWCPPCIRALPAIRQLSQFFPKDQFVLISVDEDSEQGAWRRFTSAHYMDWTQVWDEHSNLYHAFGLGSVSELSLPRYVLLDQDGLVRQVYRGTDELGLLMGQVVRVVRGVTRSGAK